MRMIVTDSWSFFELKAKYPGLQLQSLIVFTVGATFALEHVVNIFLIGEAVREIEGAVYSLIVLEVVSSFALWILVATVMYLTSSFLGGYPSFGIMFRLSGWGFIPLVISGFVRTAGRIYALLDARPPPEVGFSSFTNEWSAYQIYLEQATAEPSHVAGLILAIPFILWSGYLWFIAVKITCELDAEQFQFETKKAAMAICIPLVAVLLWHGRSLIP